MDAKEANQIPICSYLDRLGIKPSNISGNCWTYLSPYRIEHFPSFKVNLDKNLWVDFGDGNAGGTLIDLVLKMNPTFGISDAINQISTMKGQFSSLHQQNISPTQEYYERLSRTHRSTQSKCTIIYAGAK